MTEVIDTEKLLRPRRKIMGISAILLPYRVGGEVDWQGFDAHLHRTLGVQQIVYLRLKK